MSIIEGSDPSREASFTVVNRLARTLWEVVYVLLFRPSPRPLHAWRAFLLRLFGARIGPHVHVYPSARIWAPWNLEVGGHTGIGDRAVIYNLDRIRIGHHSVVSQGAHLCGGSHDIDSDNFQLITAPIELGTNVWICAEAFVAMDSRIADGVVVGARSVVTGDLAEPWTVYAGNPARAIRKRRQRVSMPPERCIDPGQAQPIGTATPARSSLARDVALACYRVFDAGYVRIMGRPLLQKLNLRLLQSTLRARGYDNLTNLAVSGEHRFLDLVTRMRPELCIDVGANVGGYSRELLARTDATVIAFEPMPKARQQLERLRAGYENRLIVFECALGDANGAAQISFGAEDSEIATLSEAAHAVDYVRSSNVNERTVQVRRLDDLVANGELPLAGKEIDLLKIDTEGYEYNVLCGAREVIRSARPKLIQIEFNWHQLFVGHSLWQFASLLPQYHVYQLLPHRGGWHRVDPKDPASNVFCFSNFVFVRSDLRLPELA